VNRHRRSRFECDGAIRGSNHQRITVADGGTLGVRRPPVDNFVRKRQRSPTGAELRRQITEELLGREESGKLALTLLTFGFKNGPPRDADLTLDVRFLPNPYYDKDLRPMTGLDEEVRAYVENGTQAGEFYGRLLPLLEFLVPAYVAEGKSHLTIAVGCTGGRHRSITVADRIRRDLAAREDVIISVKHRDVELG